MDIVTVTGLTKYYPAFTLDNISFSLKSGRIAGFIGRNGAGKTTTIKSMLNLVNPDSGEITYFGKPLSDNEAETKGRIGYSTGTISWYPRKKIRDIVAVESRFYKNWDKSAYEKYGVFCSLGGQVIPPVHIKKLKNHWHSCIMVVEQEKSQSGENQWLHHLLY